MNKILLYSALICVSMSIDNISWSQKECPVLEGKIKVAFIESNPTRPDDQKPGQEYVYDYRVLGYKAPTKEQSGEIKSLVNSGNIFDKQNVKSCLFEASFAIIGSTRTKWFPLYIKSNGLVIVSTGQCGKAIVLKNGLEKYYDLGQNNTLEQILKSLK